MHQHLPIVDIAISNDGQRVVSVSRGNSIINVWDTKSGRNIRRLRVQEKASEELLFLDRGSLVSFSEDGKVLLARLKDDDLEVWDADESLLLMSIRRGQKVRKIALSKHGKYLAVSFFSGLNDVKIWNVSTGQCVERLQPPKAFMFVSFSESGESLHTDQGIFDLEKVSLSIVSSKEMSRAMPSSPCYEVDGPWITKDGRRILWLPEEYQTLENVHRGSTVAIGLRSGQVAIFQFA